MAQPKILVADDSRTMQTIVRQTLTDAGYTVLLAADGREAVRMALQERPQLVIMDILMPEMDGYAALQEIRDMGDPWRDLPVIFISQVQSRALDMLGSQMGAYLPKPVHIDVLLSTVESLLARAALLADDTHAPAS